SHLPMPPNPDQMNTARTFAMSTGLPLGQLGGSTADAIPWDVASEIGFRAWATQNGLPWTKENRLIFQSSAPDALDYENRAEAGQFKDLYDKAQSAPPAAPQ